MDLLHFHTLRLAVQGNAYPGSGRDLQHVAENLRDLLVETGLFQEVEVESTDDPDQLVIGLCHFRPDLSEDDVAGVVERLWDERVRYPFWEAHALLLDDSYVEFEAATRSSGTGHYVTVHLVAQKAAVPAQRAPAE